MIVPKPQMPDSEPPQQSDLDALPFLYYKPRSELNVRTRTHLQNRFSIVLVEQAITTLKTQGLVDDVAFPKIWRENRETLNPKSTWIIKQKLVAKVIEYEVATKTLLQKP